MNFGTICNTTVNINGRCAGFSHYNSLAPFGCVGFGGFSPGCFGFGFAPTCNVNPFAMGAGIGVGFAAGMALVPLVPAIFKGIGKGCTWLWNNALQPMFKGIGQGCTWLWNKAIKPACQWIGNGVKNLWNKIFHKKDKAEVEKTSETKVEEAKTENKAQAKSEAT